MKFKKIILTIILFFSLGLFLFFTDRYEHLVKYQEEQAETDRKRWIEENNRRLAVDRSEEIVSRTIPNSIDTLPNNLLHLDFYGQNLDRFPTEIGEIENVYSINLKGNLLQDVVELRGFPKLHSLDLSYHEINTLFIDYESCPELEKLDLFKNHLYGLSINSTLEKLKVLDLEANYLVFFPDVSKFPNIREINLNNNKIWEIPEEILELKSLRKLLIKNNSLTEESIAILKRLKRRGVEVEY